MPILQVGYVVAPFYFCPRMGDLTTRIRDTSRQSLN